MTTVFGTKFATVNLSLLYTAKGTSAFLVPVANLVKTATGGWHMVEALEAASALLQSEVKLWGEMVRANHIASQ